MTQRAAQEAPAEPRNSGSAAGRTRLRYGFNEVDGWWNASAGPGRDQIRRRLKLMGTEVVRIFVFDKPVPNPVSQWYLFAAFLQAVLDAGAVPMITFARFPQPHHARNRRMFVDRCAEIVWLPRDRRVLSEAAPRLTSISEALPVISAFWSLISAAAS